MRRLAVILKSAILRLPAPAIVLAVALASVLLLTVAWQFARPVTIAVGETDAHIDGFYGREVGPQGMVRWSKPTATVRFPGVGVGQWQAVFTIATLRPSGHPPATIEIRQGDKLLAQLTPSTTDYNTYRLPELAASDTTGDVVLTIRTEPAFTPATERRQLGVLVDRVVLERAGLAWPAPWPALHLIAAIVLLTVALVVSTTRLMALTGGLTAVLLVSGIIFANPLWLAPYSASLVWIAVSVAAVSLLHRLLARTLPALADRGRIALVNRWIAGVLLISGLLYGAVVFMAAIEYASNERQASDLDIYLVAAERVNRGQPMYNLESLQTNQFTEWYKYPPLLAGTLRPLAGMDFDTARTVWRLFLLACLAAAIALMIVDFTRRRMTLESGGPAQTGHAGWLRRLLSPPAIMLLIVVLLFRPVIDAINVGQPDMLILLLMAVTLAGLRNGNAHVAGAALSLAVWLKLFPAAMLLYLALRREWKAFRSFGIFFVGWGALATLLTSPSDMITYFTRILPSTSGTSAWPSNQTIAGFVARVFTDRIYRLESFPDYLELRALLLRLITYASAALVIGLTIWLSRRPAKRESLAYALGFCSLLAASIFVLPVAWTHYLVVLLLPFGVLFYSLAEGAPMWKRHYPSAFLWVIVLAAVAALLIAYGNFWYIYDRHNWGGLWKLVLSYKLYGQIALWGGLLVITLLAQRAAGMAQAKPAAIEAGATDRGAQNRPLNVGQL